jgi:uncharacterized protein
MKRRNYLIYGLVLILVIFILMSFIQGYAFTHSTTDKSLEIQRNGMKMSFPELFKATLIGIRPIRHISNESPADFNLSYENVTFKSTDNITLKGWLIKFPNAKGTIIMAHGYNANRGRLDIARFLNNAGYNVLMFDFRDTGESGGNSISMGYYERKDVLGAVQFLTEKGFDPDKIYGFGQSLGAAALIFAEEQKPVFRGLILESTYSTLYDNAANRFKKVYRLPKFPVATLFTFFGGLSIGVNGFSISPLKAIKQVNKPTLFIHDSLDDSVSLKDSQRLYDAANNPKELWIVDNAQHTAGYQTQPSDYRKKILNFLNQTS